MSLIVTDLTVARTGRRLVDGLSFRVDPGEAVVLRGPNGVGKTTLLRTLAGFIDPLSGTATLGEARLDGPDGLQEKLAYAAHADGIKAQLTMAENIRFWADLFGGGDWRAALAAFDLTELAPRVVAKCSAGQKRRLGLARLLVSNRPLWLLDEPTVSLDASAREMLGRAVAAHLAQGGMALIATHDPDFLDAPRTLVLERAARKESTDPFLGGAFA